MNWEPRSNAQSCIDNIRSDRKAMLSMMLSEGWFLAKAQKRKKPGVPGFSAGRSGVIRTLDPHVPNVVRYQTALHSVTSGASIEQPIWLHKHQISKNRGIF